MSKDMENRSTIQQADKVSHLSTLRYPAYSPIFCPAALPLMCPNG